ncbi:uncharacterized protein LOC123538655 [Mercenaria mercenaria]|uniref:uncharacterized protein LOC123538655 n=1 Tax=Mercenaria mercenaria TaxID=6596 RepID=UPI00234EFCDB|nr:uncharacterized protein LOC123538655 [Mercenaria mercenaria]
MAVSGRKISDFKGSVSIGSAEDFTHSCVPCLSDDQHVEAHGFCVDCQEYLCKNCLHCHKKTKASKHHQLLDIDKVDKHAKIGQTSDVCTEKCTTHKNEVIKFFCPKHEELGCTECMIIKHRTCDLDYIPDTCTGIGDSKEYKETMDTLANKLKEADDISKKVIERNQEIHVWHDEVIRDITKFRKEINDHLDALQEKIEEEAAKRKSSDDQEVNAVLDVCATLTSNIKKIQSSLNQHKTAKQSGDLFIAIKRAKLSLHSEEVKQAENILGKKISPRFECNKALKNIISVESFGQLIEHSTSVASAFKMLTSSTKLLHAPKRNILLFHKEDINIKTDTDSQPCSIFGCVLLSSDKLVLTDYNNRKLKVVNTSTLAKAVVDEKSLVSNPFDVAVLPENQVAVTVPGKGEILIVTTAGQLAISRSIKVQGQCRGITYHHDHLYVVCTNPRCILILDTKGNVKSTLSLEDKTGFVKPCYIELSQDGQLLYISNDVSGIMGSITLQGEIYAKYNGVRTPRGLLKLDDGSLLVCSFRNKSIFRLKANFKQSQQIGNGFLNNPMSICCSPDKRELYVGGDECDQLKVFSVQ